MAEVGAAAFSGQVKILRCTGSDDDAVPGSAAKYIAEVAWVTGVNVSRQKFDEQAAL